MWPGKAEPPSTSLSAGNWSHRFWGVGRQIGAPVRGHEVLGSFGFSLDVSGITEDSEGNSKAPRGAPFPLQPDLDNIRTSSELGSSHV